jgi:geranylgeranyl pyrophosphate synthase
VGCARARRGRATGDYLFAELSPSSPADGDVKEVAVLADAVALPGPRRGDAAPAAQRPATTVEAYLERWRLKTGKLFEPRARSARAAPSAGSGSISGSPSRSRTTSSTARATTIETGKIAGTDLREGTPTLPLLLAAQEDDAVRVALAGGPIEGALLRVAATGALERSRQVALDYAREARRP